jgi:hypothetical protein
VYFLINAKRNCFIVSYLKFNILLVFISVYNYGFLVHCYLIKIEFSEN